MEFKYKKSTFFGAGLAIFFVIGDILGAIDTSSKIIKGVAYVNITWGHFQSLSLTLGLFSFLYIVSILLTKFISKVSLYLKKPKPDISFDDAISYIADDSYYGTGLGTNKKEESIQYIIESIEKKRLTAFGKKNNECTLQKVKPKNADYEIIDDVASYSLGGRSHYKMLKIIQNKDVYRNIMLNKRQLEKIAPSKHSLLYI